VHNGSISKTLGFGIYNYCLIILKEKFIKCGKLIRVMDYWLEDKEFCRIIEDE